MAFTPCLGAISANIAGDCSNPRIVGYESVALIFNRDDIDWTAVTYSASNPRIIESLAVKAGKKPFVVENPRINPASFNGTNGEYAPDTDRFDKNVQFYFDGIGGANSANVIEPLKSGSYLMILQRKDHRGDGSFPVVGLQSGLVASALVQDEETGYWLITMSTSEPSAECAFFDTDYDTTKTAFDALVANA